jgi:hypothetical protein
MFLNTKQVKISCDITDMYEKYLVWVLDFIWTQGFLWYFSVLFKKMSEHYPEIDTITYSCSHTQFIIQLAIFPLTLHDLNHLLQTHNVTE